MMRLFAVRDVKSESFGAPFSIATVGLALRGFSDACTSGKSDLSKYPADYMLYELGTYEPNTGTIVCHNVPVFVASATEMIEKQRAERLKYEPELIPNKEVA